MNRIIAKKTTLVYIIVAVLVLIDQIIKIEVKTHMHIGDQIVIFDWFRICFIENNGMAWGIELFSKYFLTILRIVAICALGWFISLKIRQKAGWPFLVCLALLMAGAIGNVVDSMFYGLCFSESTPWSVATTVPFGEGYAGFLTGKVVDMFYFPIIHTHWPSWFPFWGGEPFVFFSPVFNFADSCVTVSIFLIIIFFRKYLTVKSATLSDPNSK